MDNAILTEVFKLVNDVNDLKIRVSQNSQDIQETQRAFNGLVAQLQSQSGQKDDNE